MMLREKLWVRHSVRVAYGSCQFKQTTDVFQKGLGRFIICDVRVRSINVFVVCGGTGSGKDIAPLSDLNRFTAAHALSLSLSSAETLTLCEDWFSSSIQVSSRFNQLALFTKRSPAAFNWVPNRTYWYWIQSAGRTGSEIQDVKISSENVWTHQDLNGCLPLLWILRAEIDHPLFLNFIMWEEQYQ